MASLSRLEVKHAWEFVISTGGVYLELGVYLALSPRYVDLKLVSASASAYRRSRGVEHVFDLTGCPPVKFQLRARARRPPLFVIYQRPDPGLVFLDGQVRCCAHGRLLPPAAHRAPHQHPAARAPPAHRGVRRQVHEAWLRAEPMAARQPLVVHSDSAQADGAGDGGVRVVPRRLGRAWGGGN